jgi:hypothetical protein
VPRSSPNFTIANKAVAAIIFLLFTGIFYLDKLVLGPYAFVRIHDTLDSEFSRYGTEGRSLLEKGFFAWNPAVLCGIPVHAYHFPPHYILCLLCAIMPNWLVYSIFTILLMFIAGFGMSWFLRDFMEVPASLCFLGGLLFALQTQIHPNAIIHVVFNYAFPMFFMCTVTFVGKDTSFKHRLFAFIFILFIFLLSYPFISMPMFPVLQLAVIILFDFKKKLIPRTIIPGTIAIWAAYILLSLPVIYGIYTFGPFLHRTYGPYVNLNKFLHKLIENFIIYFSWYLHQGGVLLPVIGLAPLMYYSVKVRKIFCVMAIFAFISALFLPPHLSLLAGSIVEKMDLSHFFFTLPFLSTIFIVVCLEEFASVQYRKLWFIISFIVACLLFYKLISYSDTTSLEPLTGFLVNIFIPFFVFCFYVFWKKTITGNPAAKKYLVLTIAVFLISISLCKAWRFIRFENYSYHLSRNVVFEELRKEADMELFRVGTTRSFPWIPQTYGLETVEARSPLMHLRYKEYFKQIIMPQFKTPEQITSFDSYWYNLYLRDQRIFSDEQSGKNSEELFDLPLLLMINTKYIVSDSYNSYLAAISDKIIEPDSNKPLSKFAVRWKGLSKEENSCNAAEVFVYRLKNYFERGFLANNAVLLKSDKEVLETLSEQSVDSLHDNVFFSAGDGNIPTIGSGTQKIEDNKLEIEHYSPDKLVFNGVITSPKILVITNNYDPHWTASVNGKKQNVFRCNHAFQAVFLSEPGPVNIVLSYQDPVLWKTYLAIPAGLIILIWPVFLRFK